LQMTKEIKGYAYLGTNVPKYFPDTPWFRLIVSPFTDPRQLFQNYAVEWHHDRVVCTFEKKKDYEVTSVLQRDRPYYIYNPLTVDYALFRKKGLLAFFMESNKGILEEEHKEDLKMRHAPWFVNADGEWIQNPSDGLMWKIAKGGIAVDVRAPGTYLSRRKRVPPPLGCYWAPLEAFGTHWVCYSTNHPQRLEGLTCVTKQNPAGDSHLMLFDNLLPASGLRSLYSDQQGCYFSGDPPLGGAITDLRGPSNLKFSRGGVLQARTVVHAHVVVAGNGEFFLPTQVIEDAIQFVPDQSSKFRPLPFLPNGNMKQVRCVFSSDREYIEVDHASPGVNFFFRNMATIGRMGSMLSAFGGEWQSFEVLCPEDNSPTYGGTISANLSLNRVIDVVQRRVVENCNSDTYTAFQVARIGQVSATVVTHYCTHLPQIKIWRGYGEEHTQYVWVDNLNLYHPGKRTFDLIDNMHVIDGMMWKEVLSLIEVERVYKFASTSGGFHLREFLRRNKMSVHLESRGHYFVFHITF